MKRLCTALLCVLMMLSAAKAEKFDPAVFARMALTEMYGYTDREAQSFVMQDDGAGTLLFYDAEHPSWVYTLTYDEATWRAMTSPFKTQYEAYPGENAVREVLRRAKENRWFESGTEKDRAALQNCMSEVNGIWIGPAFETVLADDNAEAAEIVKAFFVNCYGTENGWPAALTEWCGAVQAEYRFEADSTEKAPEADIRRYTEEHGQYLPAAEVTEFKGEVPEELTAVFAAEPHLAGWTCLCGAMKQETRQNDIGAMGLAVFEKDGERILVAMDCLKGAWNLWTLGSGAVEQNAETEISILGDNVYGPHFLLRYDGAEGVRVLRVMLSVLLNTPKEDLCGHSALCSVEGYEFVSADRQEKVRLWVDWNDGVWHYMERGKDGVRTASLRVNYSRWLGVCDWADFPDTIVKAQGMPEALPEGCVLTAGVHLRKDHSSRSKDLGMLKNATVIRMLERVKGDPFDWVKTSLGGLDGYVAINYTSAGSDSLCVGREYPMPVAVCLKNVELKKSTGWFGKTAAELAAGTKMHVILEEGDWLYVVVPRGDIGWLMDVDGTYGYVRRSDVRVAAMEACLDWE